MCPATDPVQLFCLPHAGGSALAYRRWDTRTPSDVLVRPVELPGHGARMREPLVGEFDRLVSALAEEISAQIGGRYALFGHSFGALLAFELARTLRHHVGEPVILLVSGRNGPSLPAAEPLLHALSEDPLLRGLSAFGGTDERVLADPDLRALFLPIIRADLRLAETYRRA
ncbi:MAG: thioesterase II family protein [Pseudonocardiaceae bacterium]